MDRGGDDRDQGRHSRDREPEKDFAGRDVRDERDDKRGRGGDRDRGRERDDRGDHRGDRERGRERDRDRGDRDRDARGDDRDKGKGERDDRDRSRGERDDRGRGDRDERERSRDGRDIKVDAKPNKGFTPPYSIPILPLYPLILPFSPSFSIPPIHIHAAPEPQKKGAIGGAKNTAGKDTKAGTNKKEANLPPPVPLDPNSEEGMMAAFGLPVVFDSTKGKKVEGADVSGVKIKSNRQYRQCIHIIYIILCCIK